MALQQPRSRHFIDDATFELSFGRVRPAADAAEAQAQALVRALLPAVDEALDLASAELGDLVLDRVEVDLGSVPAAGVTAAERQRLRDALLAALRRAAGEALPPTLRPTPASASGHALGPAETRSASAGLWRAVRRGEVALAEVIAVLDDAGLIELATAVASMAPGGAGAADAIRRRALRLSQPRAFLEGVLQELLTDRDLNSRLGDPTPDAAALWHALRAGHVELDDLVAGRDVVALAELFEAVAGLATGSAAVELRAAVRSRLEQTARPQAFLARVLADLAAERPVDLDAAVEGPQRPPLDTSPAALARLAAALRERPSEVADWVAGRTGAELEALVRALAAAEDRQLRPFAPRSKSAWVQALEQVARGDTVADPAFGEPPNHSTLTQPAARALLARLRADPRGLAELVAGRAPDELRALLQALMSCDGDPPRPDWTEIERWLLDAKDPVGLLVRLLVAVVDRAPFPPAAEPAPSLVDAYAAAATLSAADVPAGDLAARLAALTPALRRRLRVRWQRDAAWRAALLAGATVEDRAAVATALGVDVDAAAAVPGTNLLAQPALDARAQAWLRRRAATSRRDVAALLRDAKDPARAIDHLLVALDEPALAAVATALAPGSAAALMRLEARLAHTSDAAAIRYRFWRALLGAASSGDAGTTADAIFAAVLDQLELPAAEDAGGLVTIPDDARRAYATFAVLDQGSVARGGTAHALALLDDDAPALVDRLVARLRDGTLSVATLLRGRELAEIGVLLARLLPRMAPGADELRAAIDNRIAAGTVTVLGLERVVGELLAGRTVDLDGPEADPVPPNLAAVLDGHELDAAPGVAALARALARHDVGTLTTAVSGRPEAAANLAAVLDEPDRVDVLAALAADAAPDLADALETLDAVVPDADAVARPVLWAAALEVAQQSPIAVVEGFAAAAAARLARATSRDRVLVATGLRAALTREAERTAVRDALWRGLDPAGPTSATGRVHPNRGASWTDDAGVVLVAVYLPRLFDRLGLLDEGAFVDERARGCARSALDRLVWGEVERADVPRRRLVAGLLVGEPPGEPATAGELGEEVPALVDGLLEAVVANWSAVGNTSVGALREAFLQRPGTLRDEGEHWHLRVETRAYDMLLDRLPWTYGLVRHRWMAAPLVVTWR